MFCHSRIVLDGSQPAADAPSSAAGRKIIAKRVSS